MLRTRQSPDARNILALREASNTDHSLGGSATENAQAWANHLATSNPGRLSTPIDRPIGVVSTRMSFLGDKFGSHGVYTTLATLDRPAVESDEYAVPAAFSIGVSKLIPGQDPTIPGLLFGVRHNGSMWLSMDSVIPTADPEPTIHMMRQIGLRGLVGRRHRKGAEPGELRHRELDHEQQRQVVHFVMGAMADQHGTVIGDSDTPEVLAPNTLSRVKHPLFGRRDRASQ